LTFLTNCGNESGVEGVLGESEENTGFADAGISDQEQFEKVIVRLGHPDSGPLPKVRIVLKFRPQNKYKL
jgi:hypothetical protein